MRERAINLEAHEVRAILEGRKTQTRRTVKLTEFHRDDTPGYDWCFRGKHAMWSSWRNDEFVARHCPYGKPGDRLWVRETWQQVPTEQTRLLGRGPGIWPGVAGRPSVPSPLSIHCSIIWRADGEHVASNGNRDRWRPSVHMPRWASRITLEIVAVRVERLNEISDDDAIAELGAWREGRDDEAFATTVTSNDPVGDFAALWESIHGPGSWDRNDWVWAIEFRVLSPER